jgi:hypothetical protein
MVIKRIGPLPLAKIVAVIYGVLGLVLGGFISLFAMAGGLATMAFAADSSRRGGFGGLFGIGVVVVLPLIYSAIGFVSSLIVASLYNALAGSLGGIEIDIQ